MADDDILGFTQTTNPGSGAGLYVVPNALTSPVDRFCLLDDLFKSRTGNHSVLAYDSLSAAVTAIGATPAVLEIPASMAVTADLTTPETLTLVVSGPGAFNVSATKTLTINGSIVAPMRQIFTGSGTVKFGNKIKDSYDVWFGAAGDSSTNDAAAIQKAISAFQTSNKPHAGGTVWITGGSVINSTLTIEKSSVRLAGTGWGVSNETPYSGFLKWNGSAGSPMILIQDCWNSGVENLRLIGKSSAKPSAAIEYKRQLAATTQMNHSFAKRVWIGSVGGYDSDDAIQFDAGILFTGTVDGDTNLFEHINVNKCTIGIDIQNGNASDTHFDTLKITACGTGFKNNAFVTGTNWIFGGNDVDIEILGDKDLMVHHFTTEGAKQFIEMGINASITVKKGGFQITSAISSSPAGSGIVIDASNSGGAIIVLEDCRFVEEGGYAGPNWIIKARNTGGAYKGYLRLQNVSGISADNLDVATTGGGLTDLREVFINRAPHAALDWGTNSHVYLTNSAALEEQRYDFASRVNVFGGPLTVTQIATPTNVTATPTGGSGTTYGYRVSALSGSGETLASATVTCSGGATLSGSVYNTVRWDPVLGASSYKVYGRTSGSELLMATILTSKLYQKGDGAQVTSFKDTGAITPSGALPFINSSGGMSVAGIFNGGKGADVASAATIAPTGNLFHVTGTTNITSVSGTGIVAGTEITIIFDGILTFTDGSNLKLNGNFVTSADDVIKLAWDGTNWYEVCRSTN
jgi:hypothetical protein